MSETSDDTGAPDARPDGRALPGNERAANERAETEDDGDGTEPARPDVDPGILAAAADAVAAASGGGAKAADDADDADDADGADGADGADDAVPHPSEAEPSAEDPEPRGGAQDDDATPHEDVAPQHASPQHASPQDEGAPPVSVDVADPDAESLAQIPLPVRIEAALFAATEPLPLKRLKEITGCPDGRLLRDTLDVLAASYAEHGRAFRVEEVAQGFQLRTSAEVAVVVQRLGRRAADEKLSTAALETLAVVAYRQPVLRADIERIRGVACGEVLRALQERGLVRSAGRADLPGSPILYGTTNRFLEIFGLRDIQDLPKDREVLRRPD